MERTSALFFNTNPLRFAFLGIWLVASAQAQVIERVSVSSTGEAGNNISQNAALSSDGRFVAFSSVAFNLVAQDNNGRRDIFVHDRQTDQTERISITAAGVQSNADAFGARISGDGNWVSFHSEASNLVAGGGDTNGVSDVFLKNRSTGALERISLGVGGVEGNSFSSNLGLSADAQWATLRSGADNLVAGDNNAFDDIFLVELATGSVERINVATDGTEANNFSFGGIVTDGAREIVFSSLATTMVAGDTNNRIDVFVRDRSVPETRRVVFAPGGGQLNDQARLSDATPDGRFVLFVSNAIVFDPSDTNGGFDLFVLDRDSGMVEAVSVATSGAFGNFSTSTGRISATGRYVVFSSNASNLVTGDTNGRTDIFLRDRFRAETVRLSVSDEGVQGDFNSTTPAISADGRFVAFQSLSTTLVPNDDESETDVFVAENPLWNAPPEARDDLFVVPEDGPLIGNVLDANGDGADSDSDGGTLGVLDPGQFAATGLGGEVDLQPSGDFTYTPPPGQLGVDTFTYAVGDAQGDSDTATVTLEVVPAADLVIEKTSGSFFVQPGGPVSYTIMVSNPGPSDVTQATVIDLPPARLGSVTWTCAADPGANCAPNGADEINEPVDLPEGTRVTFTLDAVLLDNANNPITNTASVTTPAGVLELVSANNSDSDTDLVGLFADGMESVEP